MLGGATMLLEVQNITKTFGDKQVLNNISFSVESGKALGLLGRNGAGKTTTIRILMDVFKANSGTILADGKPFVANEFQIGYLPEERGLYPKKTVSEQILYLASLRGLSRKEAKRNLEKMLKRLGVEEYMNRKLETLSKGNQQKIQLAQTLVCNPEIVILDEPFSGLDPVNSQILKEVINEIISEGRLVIFSSHQMSYVEEFCNDIVIINQGDIVLKGDLRQIKREFGNNRITLSLIDHDAESLRKFCSTYLGSVMKVTDLKKGYVVAELAPNKTKNDVLSTLISLNADVERFSIYEPSLTDIFVAKAGDLE